MTTITITVCITFTVILLFGLYKLSNYIYTKTIKKEQEELNTNLNHYSIFLLILGILLIVFSICAPFVFTRMSASEDFNFTETGQIGDTIDGLMSPFINMSAVIVTGLAFYMQYKANKLQVKIFNKQLQESKEQFNKEQEEQRKNTQLQQFENQFYEMLRLHKENVNEIEVKDISGNIIKGREVFFEQKKQLEIFLDVMESILQISLNEENFKKIYGIFFWGYKDALLMNCNYITNDNEYDNKDKDKENREWKKWKEYIDENENYIYNYRINSTIFYNIPIIKNIIDINLKIPLLQGHHSYLGHYYRHLFHTVKFVANQKEFISEEQKLNYLRILRAQLSNYEQIMLFYNWLGYGNTWEELEKDNGNKFFTQYRMIHNLWYNELYKNNFTNNKLEELVNRYKDLKREDELFEIDE